MPLGLKQRQQIGRLNNAFVLFERAHILPRPSLEQFRQNPKEHIRVEVQQLLEVLLSRYEVQDVQHMLPVLVLSQLAVGETFTVQEHLDDPEEFVPDVNVGFLHLVFFGGFRPQQLL